jgi:hypothetical protein
MALVRKTITVHNVEAATIVVNARRGTDLFEADIPEEMGRDNALTICNYFLDVGAYDLISDSTVFLGIIHSGHGRR